MSVRWGRRHRLAWPVTRRPPDEEILYTPTPDPEVGKRTAASPPQRAARARGWPRAAWLCAPVVHIAMVGHVVALQPTLVEWWGYLLLCVVTLAAAIVYGIVSGVEPPGPLPLLVGMRILAGVAAATGLFVAGASRVPPPIKDAPPWVLPLATALLGVLAWGPPAVWCRAPGAKRALRTV